MEIDIARVVEAVRDDIEVGFCTECGCAVHGIAADAQDEKCPDCDKDSVVGLDYITMDDDDPTPGYGVLGDD